VLAPQNIPSLPAWRRLGARARFGLRALGLTQAAAFVGCGLAWLSIRASGPPEGRAARFARRLGRTLGRLRGPFAKLGQFASLRVDLVAPELREALVALRDRVPPIPFGWVREVIEADLGAPLASLFSEIDPTPLGAASIAQVHAARLLLDGRPVVVKVQYPWLAGSRAADLAWIRLGLHTALGSQTLGPWLAEFAQGLAEELDFRHEARVAGEIAANLAGDAQVVVPRVIASHSAGRVLSMERWPTLSLGDPAALDRRGISRAQVLEVVLRSYARQIFQDGLFHADPHPGNLFVIDEPEAVVRPRVLFVDFGLSKRLAPALARELRLGMLALLARDLDGFVAGMQRLGCIAPGAEPRVREAVASMFGRLRGEAAAPLALGADRILALKDEAKQLLYETPGLALPTDLLLYAKTLSYLFALARELAPEVEPMRLTVPYLLRFLAQRDAAPPARNASEAAAPASG
jgi:predicted unusual protein kinase regulating ubiquinone biosynthesis (AarF/ABC1/UbiB family)